MLETLTPIATPSPTPIPKLGPTPAAMPEPSQPREPGNPDQLHSSVATSAAPPIAAVAIPGIEEPEVASLAEIRQGKILSVGAQGKGIAELQRRLSALGFGIQVTGQYGPTTRSVVAAFQIAWQLAPTGQVGPTTLQALEKAERLPKYNGSLGKVIAREASRIAYGRGTVGWCYRAVSDAVDRSVGRFLYGASAYMAASQLSRHPKFKELQVRHPQELKKLPAGAIVVWGRTGLSPHGHISVSLGNGREASDHVATQLTDLRGYRNYRVFIPAR